MAAKEAGRGAREPCHASGEAKVTLRRRVLIVARGDWDSSAVEEGINGSEEAVIYLTRALSRHYEVVVANDITSSDDPHYVNVKCVRGRFDLVIVWRQPHLLDKYDFLLRGDRGEGYGTLSSHDLAGVAATRSEQRSGSETGGGIVAYWPHDNLLEPLPILPKRFLFLSRWQREQYIKVDPRCRDCAYVIMGNGVEVNEERLEGVTTEERSKEEQGRPRLDSDQSEFCSILGVLDGCSAADSASSSPNREMSVIVPPPARSQSSTSASSSRGSSPGRSFTLARSNKSSPDRVGERPCSSFMSATVTGGVEIGNSVDTGYSKATTPRVSLDEATGTKIPTSQAPPDLAANERSEGEATRATSEARKKPFSFVYASNYSRGLIHALRIWPLIKKRFPAATLDIYYGRQTWGTVPDEHLNAIVEVIQSLRGFDVRERGQIGHRQLDDVFQRSQFLLYPCHYAETFCITVVKAQLHGCWPITTPLAALEETVITDTKRKLEDFGTPSFLDWLEELSTTPFPEEVRREIVKRWSWSSVADRLTSFLGWT
jgi:glycosyltransferase involved in cell wall biosynthesis